MRCNQGVPTKGDSAEQFLLNKGVVPTAMRLLVLRALQQQNVATSVSELETILAPADRITIYRTLKTFLTHCMVHQIDDGTGLPKYSLCDRDCGTNGQHHSHVHFHCTICGETRCLTDILIPKPVLPEHYQAEELNLTVSGVCPRCS